MQSVDVAHPLVRHVSCELRFDVSETAVLALQVAAAASADAIHYEHLEVLLDGAPALVPTTVIPSGPRERTHVVSVGRGHLEVRYAATIAAPAVHLAWGDDVPIAHIVDDETIAALRQSRYCPSDVLVGFAAAEFQAVPPGPGRAAAIASWVFERLAYEPGSSGPGDTAIDTLVANAGVCRDFAHVTIALCRALGIPARLAAVYAPGLFPMDFHAVVEVRVGPSWEVLDPTRLAPRQSLIRIATGRDAADTAFATTLEGQVELLAAEVSAVVDGDLPLDDHQAREGLA